MIRTCEEYYSERYKADWEYNKLNKKFTKTGVDNYVEKNPEYTKEEVINKINTDEMFAKLFIKDPVQQSCYQKYCADYISTYASVISCQTLPGSGPSALYCYKGKLCRKKDIPVNDTKLVKSIDLKVEYETLGGQVVTIYASHKHTRKDGGNQSNQWYDLIHFSEHASISTEPNTIYVALADGPYYEHTTDEGITKMEHLRKRENDHFKAMTTTDFINWLSQLD